jgi:hypothetical protein
MKKQVWLNLNTGEFSSSWLKDEYPEGSVVRKTMNEEMGRMTKEGWKLIEYECLNDSDFDFYNRMKIVSNNGKK